MPCNLSNQLYLIVCLYLTASNGDPRKYDSLHYVCFKPNQYEQAFTALADIIQDYTSNKMFPALGFGAITPSNKDVSHKFFLNLEAKDPYCVGVEGKHYQLVFS